MATSNDGFNGITMGNTAFWNHKKIKAKVSALAVFLAKKLIEKGETVDLELVEIAGLLHDVGHVEAKDKKEHAKLGEQILKEYDERLSTIVRKHMLSCIIEDPLETWEEKLVLYADKRVTNNGIVSLRERLDDLYERHAEYFRKKGFDLKVVEAKLFELEKQIFDKIGIKPEELGDYIG